MECRDLKSNLLGTVLPVSGSAKSNHGFPLSVEPHEPWHIVQRFKPRRPRLLRLSWVDLIEFDKKTKGQGIGEDERPAAKAKENRAARKRCKPSRVI